MIDVAALASLLAGERMHDTLLLAQLQRGRRHRYFLSTFDGPSSVEALVPRAGAATLRVEVLLTALEPLTVFLAWRTELGPLLAGRVRQMAALVAIAVRTPLVVEARRSPPRGGSAARLTFDLFVDEELRPWLLGCTVAPAPSDTTGYEPILPERALLDEFPFPRWADVEAAGAGERPPAIRLEPDRR